MFIPTKRGRTLAAAAVFLCIAALGGPCAHAAVITVRAGERLTLGQAIHIALVNHPRALYARTEAASVAQRVGQARSALLPQLFGSAQYLGTTHNGIGNTSYLNPGFIPRIPGRNHDAPLNAGQSFGPGNNYAAALGAYQYLFDFGRAFGFLHQRQYESAAATAAARLTDLDLIYEVTRRYFALLAAHQKVRVFEKALAERQTQLLAARVKARAGLVPDIDVYTAQAEVARAQVHLLDARNLVETAKAALDNAMALGFNAPDYQLATTLTTNPTSGTLGQYVAQAMHLRPDLAMLEDQARAEGAKIVEYRSDFFPNASAVAGYNTLGTGLPAANNYYAGVVITWPIFNGFLTEHQLEEAKLRQDALRYSIEDLRQRIFLEVKRAFLNWQTAYQRIRRTELALAASRAQLELAQKRYDTGLGNIIELTDAERWFVQNDADYVDALFFYSVDKAALDRATGALLEDR